MRNIRQRFDPLLTMVLPLALGEGPLFQSAADDRFVQAEGAGYPRPLISSCASDSSPAALFTA